MAKVSPIAQAHSASQAFSHFIPLNVISAKVNHMTKSRAKDYHTWDGWKSNKYLKQQFILSQPFIQILQHISPLVVSDEASLSIVSCVFPELLFLKQHFYLVMYLSWSHESLFPTIIMFKVFLLFQNLSYLTIHFFNMSCTLIKPYCSLFHDRLLSILILLSLLLPVSPAPNIPFFP